MSKLIIKAANGSVDDFPLEAPVEWTILELKRHLSRNYPSKPEVLFQKLVCGGKLLQDGTKITEVVSSATGGAPSGDPLVVHIVVYDRSMSAPAVSTSTSRTAQTSRDLSSSSRTGRSEVERERGSTGTLTPPRSNEPLLGDQGLRFRMGMPNDPNVQNLPMPGGGAYPYPMAPPPQFYMSPYGQVYANQFQQWYNAYYRPREVVEEGGEVGGGVDPNQLDLPGNGNGRNEAPDGEDAEEVNAPGGVGMMAGGAEVGGGLRQRDMVDYLYMFMMISFLVFVAYVTNSLGRLIIFTGGVIFMLLNQGGFFALQRRRVAVHEDDLVAAGPQQHGRDRDGQPLPQVQQEQEERARSDEGNDQNNQAEADEQHVAASDNSSSHSSNEQAQDPSINPPFPNAQNVPQGPGFLATIYVFIMTFFTSLVPQQRPELQLN